MKAPPYITLATEQIVRHLVDLRYNFLRYTSRQTDKLRHLQNTPLNDEGENYVVFFCVLWGHGGRVVTLSPPTSEAGVRFPARPQVGNLVVAWGWSAVYSTEP